MDDSRALFAVDGGGTSCRAVLVAGGRRHEAAGGPANAASDFAGAVAALRDLLGDLAGRAGIGWTGLAEGRGHLGLAGIMSPEDGRRLAAALDLPRASVDDDQESHVTGALGGADGAVCAVGTGSFLGRQSGGAIRRIGGWGFHLGDQASGGWLGRRLLQEALLARDGIVAKSPLLDAALATDLGPGGAIAFQFRARPADFARLAPMVVQSDDPAAQRLMAEGAAYLTAGLAALGWRPGETLCLTGGIGPHYAPHLGHPVTPARGTALDGGLILAGRLP
jgi:glucosamine kinase